MAIDELEYKETNLNELIEIVEKDPMPTNKFTIEDTDKFVLLGKLNEIEQHLRDISGLVSNSDSKANNALEQAIKAVQSATTALDSSNTALDSSNTALDSSNTALATANQAIETANNALQNVIISVNTSNEAKEIAQNALEQVVTGTGTKVYENGELKDTFDADKYVKNTDFATATTKGVVAFPSWSGFTISGGQAWLKEATNIQINGQNEPYIAVTTTKISQAVKAGITDNKLELTAEEKAKAQSWLDVAGKSEVATNTSDIATLKTSKAEQTALDELYEASTNAVQTLDERVEQKAEKDLSNVTYPQAVPDGVVKTGACDRVIERYISSDGLTWYEIYESGFKVCGGYYSNINQWNMVWIQFPIKINHALSVLVTPQYKITESTHYPPHIQLNVKNNNNNVVYDLCIRADGSWGSATNSSGVHYYWEVKGF